VGIFETFKNIAKKETVRRSKLPGLVKDMRSDIVEHRRTTFTPDAPAVDADTSKSEFSEQYKTVQNMSLVSFIYVLCMATYSTYTAVQSENVFSGNFITVICLLVIGSLWHFSFCVRALRARRVASLWENRSRLHIQNSSTRHLVTPWSLCRS